MKRLDFIKTVALGAGVLTTGVSLAAPKPQAISLKTLINDHSTTIELFNDRFRKRIGIRMWGIDGDNPRFRNIQEVNDNPNLNVHYFDPKTFGKDANKHFLQVNFETYDSVYDVTFRIFDFAAPVKSNSLWYAINYNVGEFFQDVNYINIKEIDGECHSHRYHSKIRGVDAKNIVIYHMNPNMPGHIRPIYLGKV